MMEKFPVFFEPAQNRTITYRWIRKQTAREPHRCDAIEPIPAVEHPIPLTGSRGARPMTKSDALHEGPFRVVNHGSKPGDDG